MDRFLIIEDQKVFRKYFLKESRYKAIYSYANNCTEVYKKIPDDLITARDNRRCEHQACVSIDNIYGQIIPKKNVKPIIDLYGEEFARLYTRKLVLDEMHKIYRSFLFAKKVIKEFSICGSVDLVPGYFSCEVYQKMRKNGLVVNNIEIPKIYLLQIRIREILRNYFFKAKLMVFPEFLFFKMKGKGVENEKIMYYKYGVHLTEGRGICIGEGGMDLIIDEKLIKNKDVLFILDEVKVSEKFYKEVKNTGYAYVDFYREMIMKYNFSRFFKKIYPEAKNKRNKLLLMCFKYPILSVISYYILHDYILWRLFADKFSVEKFITLQHPGRLTKVFFNRARGSKCFFVYASIHGNRLAREKNPEKGETVYYSHLFFDKIISDKLSSKFFATHENRIAEYVETGSVFSDIPFYIKNYRKGELKKRHKIPSNHYVISFFDDTPGKYGTMRFEDVYLFLESIHLLLKSFDNYFIIYKTKKSKAAYGFLDDIDTKHIIRDLFQNHKLLHSQNANLTNYEVMGISDLVVSSPTSSVMYEAIVAGIKSVCYDVSQRYNQDYYLNNKIPYFTAHSFQELVIYIDYWLKECSDDAFKEFQNKYIKRYVDDYCDGRAMERFRELLAS